MLVVAAPLHVTLRDGHRCLTWLERRQADGDGAAPGALWCSTRALHGRPELIVVRAAMLRCRELVTPWADARGEIVSGALQRCLAGGGASAAAQAPLAAVAARAARAERGLAEVCAGLEAAAREFPDLAGVLLQWRDRVLVTPVADVPEEVQLLSREETALDWLCRVPFSSGLSIPPAERALLPAEQPPLPPGVELPREALGTYTPTARREIEACLRENAEWHRGGGQPRARPQPAAWGDDARLPQFRGRVLDYTRGEGQGRLLPMAARATASRLHMAAVDRYFRGSRNQRPFGFMRHGCQLGAELPLQTVVGPQLLDLYRVDGGIDAVADESVNMLSRGFWLEAAWAYAPQQRGGAEATAGEQPVLLTSPLRIDPRSATEREGGPPRGLAEKGFPRKPLFTRRSREAVPSVNGAAGPGRHVEGEVEPKLFTEGKPTTAEGAQCGAVLSSMGAKVGLVVYDLTFDWKYFFHCFVLLMAEVWKMGFLLPQRAAAGGASDLMRSLLEVVLAMGSLPSSNNCQEIANEMMRSLMVLFCEADAPRVAGLERSSRPFAEMMAARRALPHDDHGSQARLAACRQYTDDMKAEVCGADGVVTWCIVMSRAFGPPHWEEGGSAGLERAMAEGAVRYIRALVSSATVLRSPALPAPERWQGGVCSTAPVTAPLRLVEVGSEAEMRPAPLAAGLNLEAAKPEKWGLGGFTKWCGAMQSSALGVVWVDRPKRVKALRQIHEALAGRMAASEWRSFVSYLGSLVFMVGGEPYLTNGLHSVMAEGGELEQGPDTLVLPSELHVRRLRRWRELLLNVPGASVLAAVAPASPAPAAGPGVVWVIRGDAALKDWPGDPTDPGLGTYFYTYALRVPLAWHPLLPELPASWLEFLTAFVGVRVWGRLCGDAQVLVLDADALATPQAIASIATSPGMVAIHEALLAAPEYKHVTHCQHSWGPCNEVGDAISRNFRKVAEELVAAMGGRLRWVPLPEDVAGDLRALLGVLGELVAAGAVGRGRRAEGWRRAGGAQEAPLAGGLAVPRRQRPATALERGTAAVYSMSSMGDGPPSREAWPVPSLARRRSALGAAASHDGARSAAVPSPPATLAELQPEGVARRLTSALGPARRRPGGPGQQEWPVAPGYGPYARPEPGRASRSALGRVAAPAARTADAGEARVIEWQAGPGGQGRETLSSSGRPRVFLPGARQLAQEAARFTEARRGQSAAARFEELYVRARSMTSICTLQDIAADTSSLALRPANSQLLGALLDSAQRALARRQPATTARQDKSNWKFWCEWCELMGTSPVRSDSMANQGLNAFYGRELALVVGAFMFWCATTPYKPKSMMARLYGVARRHKRLELRFISLSMVAEVCKGVVQDYIDEHGADWLAQKRKEPVTNEMIKAWLSLPVGLVIGKFVVGANVAWQGVRVCIVLCAAAGFRCSDVALESGASYTGNRHLSMGDVRWEVDGVRGPSLPDWLLRQLAAGLVVAVIVFVHVTAPPSKADADGLRWRASPISVRYDAEAPINLAREMARYEYLRRLRDGDRRETPVLVDHDGKPWRRQALNAFFKLLLRAIPQLVPPDMIQHYSMHSFRIYLACALLAVGATPETIKLMVRWASDEALQIYARINVGVDAALRARAATAQIHSVRSSTMAAAAAPDWAEEPADDELHRRAELRAAAAGVEDVAAVDRSRAPVVDLHDRMAAVGRGIDAAQRAAERADATLEEDEDAVSDWWSVSDGE